MSVFVNREVEVGEEAESLSISAEKSRDECINLTFRDRGRTSDGRSEALHPCARSRPPLPWNRNCRRTGCLSSESAERSFSWRQVEPVALWPRGLLSRRATEGVLLPTTVGAALASLQPALVRSISVTASFRETARGPDIEYPKGGAQRGQDAKLCASWRNYAQ